MLHPRPNGGTVGAMTTRADLLIALALLLALFGLYAWSAAPEVTFHDSGELIAAACRLGIGHPPGAPTWCLIGHLFTRLPVGSIAYRIHLMCALCAALACAFTYLFAACTARGIGPERAAALPRLAGLVAALILAQTPAFWEKAVQAELYTMNALFLAAILFLFARWEARQKHAAEGCDRLLVAIAALFGIGAGNYLALLYYAPILATAVLVRRPAILREPRLLLRVCAAFVLGLSVYLYLPIRSLADPPLDWGNPESLQGLLWVLSRKQWGPLQVQPATWQFICEWLGTYQFVRQLGLVGVALALGGVLYTARKSGTIALVLTACFCVYAGLMMWTQATTGVLARNLYYVTTYGMAEFHIPLYQIAAICAGLGAYGLATGICRRCRGIARRDTVPHGLCLLTLAVLAGVLARRARACGFRNYIEPYAFGTEMLASVPQDGSLHPWNDNTLHILCYLQQCRGQRPDVRLISGKRAYYLEAAQRCIESDGRISSRDLIALLRSDPEKYEFPMLNQNWPAKQRAGPVVFEAPFDPPAFMRYVYPCRLAFRLRSEGQYRKDEQAQYWQNLLQTTGFTLEPDSKRDFRENMVRILRIHARWHYEQSEYELAKLLYLAALRYAPHENTGLYALAAASVFQLGELETAAGLCEKALALDCTCLTALNCLGVIRVRQRQFDAAEHAFRQALAFHPKDETAKKNLQLLLQKKGAANAGKASDAHNDGTPTP